MQVRDTTVVVANPRKGCKSQSDAEAFIGWCRFTRKLKSSTIQRLLNTLKAVDRSNFGQICVKAEQTGIPVAYTLEQQRAILDFLKQSKEYGFYHDLVKFLFLTGCRTSEALALQWKHVDFGHDSIYVVESLATQANGTIIRKETKTGKGRTINMTPEMKALLLSRKPAHPDPGALVFPSPRGGIINRNNFARRCWRACLEAAGIPYEAYRTTKTRHSAISRALAAGLDPVAVAQQTGHDIQTLYGKYASVIRRVELPGLDG